MSTYINESNNSRYGFKAPNIAGDAGASVEVPFPTQ